MNEVQTELARELVAHPRWRWMDGMAVVDRYGQGRILSVEPPVVPGVPTLAIADVSRLPRLISRASPRLVQGLRPDITDAATVGCLLSMLHETGRLSSVFTPDDGQPAWEVALNFDVHGAILGEALARALLTAWRS